MTADHPRRSISSGAFAMPNPLVFLQTQARDQRLQETRQLALDLFSRHGLPDWSLGFNRGKRAMGWCLYGSRTIELSVHFVERNSAEVIRDTLLHEIAHALVGEGHGHDVVWKRKCLEIGARPERLSYEVNMPDGRWQARCGQCGLLHHRHRRPKWLKGWYCTYCGKERGQLVWYLAGQPV
jgi:predicted SprT family Zn-dependent metalloprotease